MSKEKSLQALEITKERMEKDIIDGYISIEFKKDTLDYTLNVQNVQPIHCMVALECLRREVIKRGNKSFEDLLVQMLNKVREKNND